MLTQTELVKRQGGNIFSNRMAPTKIQAFMEEFPWIRKHVREPIVQAYVSRVESSLLNYFPEQTNVTLFSLFDPFGSELIYERILLLNEEREVVTAETEKKSKKFFFFGPCVSKIKKISGIVFCDSSVGSAVEQLGEKTDSVHFLLSYYSYTKAVIIYKIPDGLSLRKWIEREVESEKINLQNTLKLDVN